MPGIHRMDDRSRCAAVADAPHAEDARPGEAVAIGDHLPVQAVIRLPDADYNQGGALDRPYRPVAVNVSGCADRKNNRLKCESWDVDLMGDGSWRCGRVS